LWRAVVARSVSVCRNHEIVIFVEFSVFALRTSARHDYRNLDGAPDSSGTQGGDLSFSHFGGLATVAVGFKVWWVAEYSCV